MDFIGKQIDLFKKRKQDLMDEIKKLDRAITALMGVENETITDRAAMVDKKRFQCMTETVSVFSQHDYLSINEAQEIMIDKGIEQARGSRGRNAINTTFGRLHNRGALGKTSENKFYKTEQWEDKIKPPKRRLMHKRDSKPAVSDAAYQELLKCGKQIHYVALMELIQKKGVEVGGKDPKSTMSAHLSNDKRFISKGGGMWTLKEWKSVADTSGNDEEVVSLVSANESLSNDKPTLRLRRLHRPTEE